MCALLAGGGYAEKVAVPAGQVLPVPSGITLKDAAGLPEVACTVWSTIFMMSHLSAGETFLASPSAVGYLFPLMFLGDELCFGIFILHE